LPVGEDFVILATYTLGCLIVAKRLWRDFGTLLKDVLHAVFNSQGQPSRACD